MSTEPTDDDREAVRSVVEIAATSDLPEWALTQLRGAAAQAVAKAREEGRAALHRGIAEQVMGR